VLAHFKLGVILGNMYKRFLGGGTVGTGFEATGAQARNLGRAGLARNAVLSFRRRSRRPPTRRRSRRRRVTRMASREA